MICMVGMVGAASFKVYALFLIFQNVLDSGKVPIDWKIVNNVLPNVKGTVQHVRFIIIIHCYVI